MLEKFESLDFEGLQVRRLDHLGVVAAFCRRIGLVESINMIIPGNMAVDLGTMTLAMVLDTLSGRSPLYRLSEFVEEVDVESLLGGCYPARVFNDTSLARALDAIYEYGTEKLFSQLAFSILRTLPLDMRHVHFDTTSVNVWGGYESHDGTGDAITITHGHSKDKRPDLKQFMVKMLCVKRNIPIAGGCEDGNASDKTLNKGLLAKINDHMTKYGLKPGAFVYIADSALITPDNLSALGDNLFISRLPFSYAEADRVVSEAVREDAWIEVGALAKTPETANRPAARYKISEHRATIAGTAYRAVVAHSSAHDKRRLKKLNKRLANSLEEAVKTLKEESKIVYFCRPDAEAAARRAEAEFELHRLELRVEERVVYARGRPSKSGERKIARREYLVAGDVLEKSEEVNRRREESGCFVLLTNIPEKDEGAYTGREVLAAYKDQHGIERNFSFLKDPLVVNDTFFKMPRRIEALGFVLLTSLLVWNLMEDAMREFIAKTNSLLPGWDNKLTSRPTSFMMSTKFRGMMAVRLGDAKKLAKSPSQTQIQYLKALGLSAEHIIGKR